MLLRRMEESDVPFAMELKDLAGWNQTAADWRGYLAFEPDGCFVAELEGRPVGTATTLAHGGRFGWIGMVLVHPSARRLGVGTALLRHAIAYLQARGVEAVKLDATAMGRAVYVPLGFQDEYEVTRFEGVAPAAGDSPASAAMAWTETDLCEVVALDAAIFGAERPQVVRSLCRRNPELCLVRRGAAGVRGYLIAREGQNALQLGPWGAEDVAVAEELLGEFLRRAAGRKVFVDTPAPNAAAGALLERHGFRVQRRFTRMFLGANAHPGRPAQVFGTSGAEKG